MAPRLRGGDRDEASLCQTRAERPFHINAWVVLPDHMHSVWTLPDGNSGYANRIGAIKARFAIWVRGLG